MSKKMSRRDWSMLSLSGLAGLMIPSALVSCKTPGSTGSVTGSALAKGPGNLGVVIGAQTYSFRDMNLGNALKAMNEIGIKSCELYSQHLEPEDSTRNPNPTAEEKKKRAAELKQWRATVSMNEIKAIRDRINKAGITVQAYNGTFPVRDTDEEFEQNFRTAQALGTDTITTSATVAVMKRVDALAQKYKIKVAMHNHAHIEDPNQFATPESFERGMAGNS